MTIFYFYMDTTGSPRGSQFGSISPTESRAPTPSLQTSMGEATPMLPSGGEATLGLLRLSQDSPTSVNPAVTGTLYFLCTYNYSCKILYILVYEWMWP